MPALPGAAQKVCNLPLASVRADSSCMRTENQSLGAKGQAAVTLTFKFMVVHFVFLIPPFLDENFKALQIMDTIHVHVTRLSTKKTKITVTTNSSITSTHSLHCLT